MDTANLGNLLWAVAVIGGPIVLGLVILWGVFQRRRRNRGAEDLAHRQAAERQRRTGTATTGGAPGEPLPPTRR